MIPFRNSYLELPPCCYARVTPQIRESPTLIAVNEELLERLQIGSLESDLPSAARLFSGSRVEGSSHPIALAYAGHQFGSFVPSLGDGRAILLGQLVDDDGRTFDVQLKGAGRTPFSRGGDGQAALGPVLREYLVSEAMTHLGVPSTRALAATATGDWVERETPLAGAVLTRVASSHLRIGTFEYFAARDDRATLGRLTDYAITRHYPQSAHRERPIVTFFEAVLDAQVRLLAHWQSLGFVHGVMNTDNTAISGESLDFGPCAFLDVFAPERWFSSIDTWGRYRYSQQPRVLQWNLARLAEALLPLLTEDHQAAPLLEELLRDFPNRFRAAYLECMRAKLGLWVPQSSDQQLVEGLLTLLAEVGVDYTAFFRRLCDVPDAGSASPVETLFARSTSLHSWIADYLGRLGDEAASPGEVARRMRRRNPCFIPRNHLVEEALEQAARGDFSRFERLRRVLRRPYDEQPDAAELATPPGAEQWSYRTFCGT